MRSCEYPDRRVDNLAPRVVLSALEVLQPHPCAGGSVDWSRSRCHQRQKQMSDPPHPFSQARTLSLMLPLSVAASGRSGRRPKPRHDCQARGGARLALVEFSGPLQQHPRPSGARGRVGVGSGRRAPWNGRDAELWRRPGCRDAVPGWPLTIRTGEPLRMPCPRCQHENPSGQKFCGRAARPSRPIRVVRQRGHMRRSRPP